MRALVLLIGLAAGVVHAQTPDCVISFNFVNVGDRSSITGCGHNSQGVVDWRVIYASNGFSAISLRVESAPDSSGSPGTWVSWAGTVVTPGINPNTSTTQATTEVTGFFPWVSMHLVSASGSGKISGVLYGCRQPGCANSASNATGGTVTSVATGCGLSGGTITTTGTIALSQVVNGQTGTTYAIQNSDCGKLLTFTNGSNMAVSLAQAGSGGNFIAGWSAHIQNRGAGSLTITPATSTIDGASAFTLIQNQGIAIFSDGTNYFTERGANAQVSSIVTGCGLSGGTITTTGTIALSQPVNNQTGTSYAIQNSDCGNLVTFSNAGTVTATIAQAGSGGNFISGWSSHLENRGAGAVTVTPSTSTIDGGTSITLSTNQGVVLFSDGTNYFTERGLAPAGTPQLHSITFVLDGGGSPIATGAVNKFPPVDYSCTINRIDVTGNPSGSITADIWKASGAIPTAANKISASAPATLSSSQINLNGSLTGWTTSVSVGDVFGATVATVASVTSATIVMWCQ